MESGDGDDYLEFCDYSLFYILPNEIVVSIFSYLSVPDLCWRVSRVSKQWHNLAGDGGLWKDLYAKQWPNLPAHLRERVDYEAYRCHSLRLRQLHGKSPTTSPATAARMARARQLLPAVDADVLMAEAQRRTLEADQEELEQSTDDAVTPLQHRRTADHDEDEDISGDDSGDDSGDEDSGHEEEDDVNESIASEDEAVLRSPKPRGGSGGAGQYNSGDERGFSPRMVRADSADGQFPSHDVADLEEDEEEEEEDEEANRCSFECFTDSFDSPTISASSVPTSPAPQSRVSLSPATGAARRSPIPASAFSGRDVNNNSNDDAPQDLEIDWRKSFSERMERGRNWRGKPADVATLRGHTLAVMSVISNGRTAASCSLDGTIRTWDLDRRRCTGVFSGHTDWVNSIDHDEGRAELDVVVSGSYDTSVRLWDTKNKKCQRVLWGHQNIVWAVQLAGNRVVSCSSDATVRVWDVEAGLCTQTLTGHEAAIYCCQFDPARNLVITGSMDRTLRFWDLSAAGNARGGCVGVMRGHTDRLCCMQEDPAEHLLVTGSRDSTIRLWDTRVIESASSSASASSAAAGESRACYRVLRGHEGRVCCLQFDEDKIVSGSDDNTVKVWSLHDRAGTASSSSSSSPSSSSSSTMAKQQPSYCINTFTAHDYWVNSLTFRDNMLISGAADDTIKLWDFSSSSSSSSSSEGRRGARGAAAKTGSGQQQRWFGSGSSAASAAGKKGGTGGGLWYAGLVSARPPQQTYITNPITSACILS